MASLPQVPMQGDCKLYLGGLRLEVRCVLLEGAL